VTRRFDAILFDWDDTLCGAEPHRFVYARQVARDLGIDLTLPEVYAAFVRAGDSAARPWGSFIEGLPVELGIPAGSRTTFVRRYQERDLYKRFLLFDDVLDLLDHLTERELRVGIISNNDEVARHVERLDIQHRFEIVVSPETFGVGKPDPAIFQHTLAALDVPPERSLYVGDSWDNDVIGARAAGLTPILIDRLGLNLTDQDTAHRIDGFQALRDLLVRLL
jgi:putative hydrolase of the HAD superfamily